jgi:NAD(P)-dependent dehydrogenase (short-subunit alcohol dehydrogenase family)
MTQRTALIVGGTSGIGLATARRLNALGAAVHVVGRGRERLQAVAASDPALTGHRADGGDREQIDGVLEAVGRVDWLVVTLTGSGGAGRLADLDLDGLRRAFDDKVWGYLTTLRAALPHLAPDGSATLLGGITARSGVPGTSGRAAINGAVEALVKPLAAELAPIRVNGVSPGWVDTPRWSDMPEDARQTYLDHTARQLPVRRIATADDIAEVVVLAATNPNITGTVIETDGGSRLVAVE